MLRTTPATSPPRIARPKLIPPIACSPFGALVEGEKARNDYHRSLANASLLASLPINQIDRRADQIRHHDDHEKFLGGEKKKTFLFCSFVIIILSHMSN